MATEKIPSKTRKQSSQSPNEASVSSTRGGCKTLESALTNYITQLAQAGATLQETQQQALRTYFEALGRAGQEAQQEMMAGRYEEMMAALQSQDAERIRKAYTACTESTLSVQSNAAERAKSALDDYGGHVREAWEKARGDTANHYQSFLDGVKAALAEASSETLDSEALAYIGHGLVTAAAYTAAASRPLAASAALSEHGSASR